MKDRLKSWLHVVPWADLLEFVLLAALGMALAWWTWIIFTPAQVSAPARSEAIESTRTDVPVKRHLFGAGKPGSQLQQESAANSSFQLVGVISPAETSTGRAIVKLQSGGRRVVSSGEALSDGVMLKEVYPDHVLVTRAGATERIDLERRATVTIPRKIRRDDAH